MDFIKTFLALTEYTIPHGSEDTVAHLLPEGIHRDKKGNYFITIGEGSETLFTCHLDTVSKKRLKVNHVIKNDNEKTLIGTDGTTILGGDNKAGVCILMYLIEQKVPGTYYFFTGEEVGAIGSNWALSHNKKLFSTFKRAVAFDRKKYGSIITSQRGSQSTSMKFAETLSAEFQNQGMDFKPDKFGIFTDTAVFMSVIPECTNISSGVFGEHTCQEYVDITYVEAVAIASAKIDWEKLPSIRTPKSYKKTFLSRNTLSNWDSDYYSRHYSTTNHVPTLSYNKPTYAKPTSKPKIRKVTMDEAKDMAIQVIKDMIYKQEVYKKHVNINALMFDQAFNSYKYRGNDTQSIENILQWLEESKRLTKQAIYSTIKPYLRKEFWDERLSEKNIAKKIESLTDIKIIKDNNENRETV